jgi:hypothetical protein
MNKREEFFLVFIFLIVILINFVSADIISINSGGDSQLCINSGGDIENCFSSGSVVFCVPQNCSALGYNCGSISDGCGNTLNCGSCLAGYTCSLGICTLSSTSSSSSSGGSSSGGGTGGITVNPRLINLTLSFNNVTHMSQRSVQQIYISNNGNSAQTLSITQTGLDEIALLGNTSITVGPGEAVSISVDFIAPFREDDISGKIFIGSYDVAVSMHVTSNPLWFDSNIVVLNKDYQVPRGTQLKTRVELVPMGDKQKIDVTLNYVIKSYDGKVYLTQQETMLVGSRVSFDRNFGTGLLPLGQYVISLDLIYPGGVAPSNAHFEITKQSLNNLLGVILFFISLGILFLSLLIILFIMKRKRRRVIITNTKNV